jgi:pimeloyl-ACP methyl ester carboxylesterase
MNHTTFPQPRQTQTDRPTVVLLHSSGASSRQWDRLAAALRPVFDVHAIDLHGHGRQAPWAGDRALSVHDDATLALPVIERSGGAHVIGHSYGGAVALHLAAAHPSKVHSIVVYEPVLFNLLARHEPGSAAAAEAFNLAATLKSLVSAGDHAMAAARFVDYWSGAATWGRMAADRQAAVAARMPVIVQHFDTLYRDALPPAWQARLTMPMLCMAGGRSTAAAQRIARLLVHLLPFARHQRLDDLGHMGPITDAPLVNERLLDFLGSLSCCAGPMAQAA